MKTKLAEIINNIENESIDNIYNFFEKTEDILIIKYDGLRKNKKYTIIIIGKESRFETIRLDCIDLKSGFEIALKEYANFV